VCIRVQHSNQGTSPLKSFKDKNFHRWENLEKSNDVYGQHPAVALSRSESPYQATPVRTKSSSFLARSSQQAVIRSVNCRIK